MLPVWRKNKFYELHLGEIPSVIESPATRTFDEFSPLPFEPRLQGMETGEDNYEITRRSGID